MRKFDGIYRKLNSPVVKAGGRRVGIVFVLFLLLASLAASNGLPETAKGETGQVSGNRLWESGAELQATTNNWEFGNFITAAPTITTSTVHSGNAAYEFNRTASIGGAYQDWATTAQTGSFFFRLYVYIKTLASSLHAISCTIYDSPVYGGTAAYKICVELTAANKLALYNGLNGTLLATGSTTLTTSTWYRVEYSVNDTTLASTTASLRLNGATEVATQTVSITNGVNGFEFGPIGANVTADEVYDDLAINNATSRTDNWVGDSRFAYLRPGGAGDSTQWAQNGTCTGGNYACLNETTPNNATNYISLANSTAGIDDYTLSSYTAAGITAGDTIKMLSLSVEGNSGQHCVKTVCTGGTNFTLQIEAAASGTKSSSAALNFDGTSCGWSVNSDCNWFTLPLNSYTKPGTNTNWSTSDLTSIQIGINAPGTLAVSPQVSALWLIVEYMPASGGRIFSSGFESNTTGTDVIWSSTTGSPTIQSTTVRSGTYALQTAGSGAQSYIKKTFVSANGNGAYFVRAYIDIGTAESAEYSIMELQDSTNTRQAWVTLTSSNTLKLYSTSSSGAQIGSASVTLSPGNWYRLEMKFDRTAAGGSQSVALQLNGTSVASSSSLTITNGITQLVLGNNIGNVASPTTGQLYFDDVAINQNIGTTQNSYPGEGRILVVRPNAAGDNSGWTKNGAGCTGGANYTCVNEVTPDDATTYVSTSTTNTIDDYAVASTGINSNSTISLVQVGVRFRTSATTEGDFRIRLKDSSGGVPIESNNLTPASSTWVTNTTASPYIYSMTAYTRPEQSSSWTKATLDTAQIGIRYVNSTTGQVQVTSEWMLVEYVPQTISITGHLYQTNETSPITSSPTVAVKVNGAGSYTATANALGAYTISGINSQAGDSLTVYISGATPKAATFTVSSGANLSGVNLYQDRATTECDNLCSLTNSNINYYMETQNSDIHATTSSGNLIVDNDWKLKIVANTFAPGGAVTMSTGGSNSYSGDVEIVTTATLNMAGNALSISGNYTNSGTFTSSSNTTTFTSTSGTKNISGTLNGGSAFYNLTFNGSGGTWTLGAATTVSNNLAISAGTLNDGGFQITGNGTGTLTMASGGTLKLGTTGSATTWPTSFTSGNTTLNSTSLVIYNATIAQTISGTPTYGNLQLSAASGTPTKTLGAATTIAGNLTIDANNTLDTSSGNNYAINLAGNLTNNGTFTARNNTVTLNGSAQQTLSGTMTGGSAFYNLTFTNASGANASDCELTGFSASVKFTTSATVTNNLTFTTASSRIQYNSGSTYTFTNINWNGQASGTPIYFRNSVAGSGSWALNVSGAQTAVSYINVSRSNAGGGNQIVANNGTNTDCGNNTNWLFTSNLAPNSPTSLAQTRYTGGSTITTGGWTSEAKVTFTATVSDQNNPDTDQLCVEVVPIANSFTNTETGCGTGVSYAGTPLTATYSNTSLTDQTQYKWQARVKDAGGLYSAWVQFNAGGTAFGVDAITPSGGTVADGTNTGSLTSLSASWSGVTFGISGIQYYEYSVGTTAGGTDILAWTNNSTSTSASPSGLVLHTNQVYYTNVRSTSNAGLVSTPIISAGQTVLPQLSFSLSGSSITFNNLNAANNLQDSQTTTLTTSTNAYGGYVIQSYAGGLLSNGSNTIPMFSAGSYATPASWGSGLCSGSSCGFGYTSSDTTIQGSNKFGSGTLYAPFSLTAPGDIVADHTTAVTGATGAVSNESFTITCKIAVSKLQPSMTYSGTIYYIATGTF